MSYEVSERYFELQIWKKNPMVLPQRKRFTWQPVKTGHYISYASLLWDFQIKFLFFILHFHEELLCCMIFEYDNWWHRNDELARQRLIVCEWEPKTQSLSSGLFTKLI